MKILWNIILIIFFLGYKIPQIGEEFDLLRLGKNYHLNIELKSEASEEKILKTT
ncbi:hypothetical protein MAQA_09229 [Listeria aquatica FSL S10-1188]|uniref:Uncharacterized protein n=1 Tax=Listeria aquatica FSL S10-1188 TaxID=1265818 RepID=W7B6C4_9LIST|nr:hypothetical protein MAQA_09229 [Listeria aquatica FSL S10-1188]